MKALKRLSGVAGGLAPVSRSSVLTVSIEGATLNLVLVQKRHVARWLTMPFNPRMVNRGSIQEPTALSGVLKSAVARLAGRGVTVVAAYPGAAVVTRVIDLPSFSGINIDMVVARQARSFLGTAVDAHYLFWAPLNQGARIYIVAVARREMDNFMQTMLLSGLRPRKVEPPPLALARGVGMPNTIILNVGLDRFQILGVADFLPEIIAQRELELGTSGDELVAAVSEEMERATAYYAERNPSEPSSQDTPIHLVGRHPQVDESLAESLQTALRRPVRLPTTSLSCPPDFPVAQYMVNVGLSLKG